MSSKQPPTEKVKEDVKALSYEVARISATHELYLKLANQQKTDVHVLNPAPAFFGRIFESTETEILLSLAKLYGARDTEQNLEKLVDFVGANRSEIEWGYEEIPRERIEKHRRLLKNKKEVVEDVNRLREKFYSEHDPDYLLVAEDLTADCPLEAEEVEMLIEDAKSILRDYRRALAGKDIPKFGRMDVDRVFQALGEFYKGGEYTLVSDD